MKGINFSLLIVILTVSCSQVIDDEISVESIVMESFTEGTNFKKTDLQDSIKYELHLNGESFSHLDSIIVALDIINLSFTQEILVDTFNKESGLMVLDENGSSPVIAYWHSYVSEHIWSQEKEDRKITIKPQSKVQVSFQLTKRLDFGLRKKIVPRGSYITYYFYSYYSPVDSCFHMDSTSNVRFYLKEDSGGLNN